MDADRRALPPSAVVVQFDERPRAEAAVATAGKHRTIVTLDTIPMDTVSGECMLRPTLRASEVLTNQGSWVQVLPGAPKFKGPFRTSVYIGGVKYPFPREGKGLGSENQRRA
jgi:hypothetical protein